MHLQTMEDLIMSEILTEKQEMEQKEHESSYDRNNSEDKVVTLMSVVEEHLTTLMINLSGGDLRIFVMQIAFVITRIK